MVAAIHAAVEVIETTVVNGVPIVCETIPFFKSTSFAVWIFAGARDEPEEKSGLFHFMEHLVFKGTANRDARAIAIEIDELGGLINAFTSREITCYSGHVIAQRLDRAFDLIADITLNSSFPDDEMELERHVVLEEIRSIEDNPSEFVYDRLYPRRWAGHPLGKLITGSPETVNSLTRDDLISLKSDFYTPPRIVVTACGSVTMPQLERLVSGYFGNIKPNEKKRDLKAPASKAGLEVIQKPLEQAHVLLAAEGIPAASPRRHELLLLNIILGDGVSSRLFQNVREKQGLAYSIYSFFDQYIDTGLFGVYAASSPDVLRPLWETALTELDKIADKPPSAKEFARAKTQVSDNLKMSFESLGVRLSQIAHQTLYYGKVFTLDEMLEHVNAVKADGVRELAEELLGRKNFTVLALGPVEEDQVGFIAS